MILALLMRRIGLDLAVFFLYVLVFEQLLGGLIDFKVLTDGTVRYYFPLQPSDTLIPITFGGSVIYKNAPSQTILLVMCVVYIGLFVVLSFRKFQTDDL
jgi:hypothetical protein